MYEYPTAEGDPYYPVPRPENSVVYRKYEALARVTPHVHFVGRLATYKYYNMDQIVAQALTLAAKIAGTTRRDCWTLLLQRRCRWPFRACPAGFAIAPFPYPLPTVSATRSGNIRYGALASSSIQTGITRRRERAE